MPARHVPKINANMPPEGSGPTVRAAGRRARSAVEVLKTPHDEIAAYLTLPAEKTRPCVLSMARLGKSTTMEWLHAQISGVRGFGPFPILRKLEDNPQFDRLRQEIDKPRSLLHEYSLLDLSPEAQQHTLNRYRTSSRITLLLDGLDHRLTDPDMLRILPWALSDPRSPWRSGPVWVSGRPYAFERMWDFVKGPEWTFLRIKPLEAPEVKFYLASEEAGVRLFDYAAQNATPGPRYVQTVVPLPHVTQTPRASRRTISTPRFPKKVVICSRGHGFCEHTTGQRSSEFFPRFFDSGWSPPDHLSALWPGSNNSYISFVTAH